MQHQEEIPVRRPGMLWMAILTIMTAVGITVYAHWPTHIPTGDKACYSDDDGQTWFTDSYFKVVPFDHNGKQAYRANVYTYANGKYFTAFLMRYTADGQKALNDAIAKANAKNVPLGTLQRSFDSPAIQEVKAPGPNHPWVPRFSRDAQPLLRIESPDGSVFDMVIP